MVPLWYPYSTLMVLLEDPDVLVGIWASILCSLEVQPSPLDVAVIPY